jgi:hypothetical protein
METLRWRVWVKRLIGLGWLPSAVLARASTR